MHRPGDGGKINMTLRRQCWRGRVHYLIPAGEKLGIRLTEEASHVGPGEGQPAQVDGQQHRSGDLQVAPLRRVISYEGKSSLNS